MGHTVLCYSAASYSEVVAATPPPPYEARPPQFEDFIVHLEARRSLPPHQEVSQSQPSHTDQSREHQQAPHPSETFGQLDEATAASVSL